VTTFEIQPIGVVRADRDEPTDDGWDSVPSRIELDPAVVDPDATLGLDGFSHIDVVFVFDQVRSDEVCRGSRHPRGRDDWPLVGILAQRAKDRPNRLGVTTCGVVKVDGTTIQVTGLDAIDGTPVVDIKPHMGGFEPRGPHREPPWAVELMTGYW
jgi:tRNA-Thr(GGU) m(6)t(6)A37 methyltransferase TsaA